MGAAQTSWSSAGTTRTSALAPHRPRQSRRRPARQRKPSKRPMATSLRRRQAQRRPQGAQSSLPWAGAPVHVPEAPPAAQRQRASPCCRPLSSARVEATSRPHSRSVQARGCRREVRDQLSFRQGSRTLQARLSQAHLLHGSRAGALQMPLRNYVPPPDKPIATIGPRRYQLSADILARITRTITVPTAGAATEEVRHATTSTAAQGKAVPQPHTGRTRHSCDLLSPVQRTFLLVYMCVRARVHVYIRSSSTRPCVSTTQKPTRTRPVAPHTRRCGSSQLWPLS